MIKQCDCNGYSNMVYIFSSIKFIGISILPSLTPSKFSFINTIKIHKTEFFDEWRLMKPLMKLNFISLNAL